MELAGTCQWRLTSIYIRDRLTLNSARRRSQAQARERVNHAVGGGKSDYTVEGVTNASS